MGSVSDSVVRLECLLGHRRVSQMAARMGAMMVATKDDRKVAQRVGSMVCLKVALRGGQMVGTRVKGWA